MYKRWSANGVTGYASPATNSEKHAYIRVWWQLELGLADELGSYSDAVRKGRGVSWNLQLRVRTDVNLEDVLRELVESLDFVFPGGRRRWRLARTLSILANPSADGAAQFPDGQSEGALADLQTLRNLILDQGLGASEEDPLPGLPVDIHRPDFYYLYVGHAP